MQNLMQSSTDSCSNAWDVILLRLAPALRPGRLQGSLMPLKTEHWYQILVLVVSADTFIATWQRTSRVLQQIFPNSASETTSERFWNADSHLGMCSAEASVALTTTSAHKFQTQGSLVAAESTNFYKNLPRGGSG